MVKQSAPIKQVEIFKPHPIHGWTIKAAGDYDIIVHQGGTNSGKTYSILQVLFVWALADPGSITTIVAQDGPNHDSGGYRDMKNIIFRDFPECSKYVEQHHKGKRTFYLKNGSLIEFKSYDDAQDASNGKRHYLYINEAPGISYEMFKELHDRTSKTTIIDYNPHSEFWVHDHLLGREDVIRFISNFRHNPYLDKNILKKILAYFKYDPHRWRVMGLGKTGEIEGLVHKKVRQVPHFPKQCKRVIYGIDFGFVNSETAIIKTGLLHGEIFGEQLAYDTGMNVKDIIAVLEANGVRRVYDIIVADSAEPMEIKELQDDGWNVIPCTKGAGSVKTGIGICNQYWLNITFSSKGWWQEKKSYKYKKVNGIYLNEPVGKFDHCMNAWRYIMHKFYNRGNRRKQQRPLPRGGVI